MVLEPNAAGQDRPADPLEVVVINDGESSVGMVVDQILDVTEEAVTVRQESDRNGLLGSAVVGKQVTDFIDLHEVIRAVGGDWFQGTNGHVSGQRILVADPSAFSRAMVRSSLDMAGYVVIEAANLDEAMRKLEQQPTDVVLAALDLPPGGSSALLAAMRSRPEWNNLPVLALADSAEQMQAATARTAGFGDCLAKFDHVLVLESVAKLISPVTSFAVVAAGTGGRR